MKILFVCAGNTCRSVMAQYYYNYITKSNDADSCGAFCFGNSPASINSIKILEKNNIKNVNHLSKPISLDLINNNDLVLTLTKNIEQNLKINYPASLEKIYTLKKYCYKKVENENISDPYGGDILVYQKCFDEIKSCLDILHHQTIKKS